jgi:superfamily II DNA or RNA helicase
MNDIFDVTAFEYNLQEAIKDGNLCELDAVRIKTNLSLDDVHTVGGEFNQKELADEVNCYKRNKLIVDSYIKYCSGIQGIFFCVDIKHCLDLLELFLEAGINAKAVSSDEERTPNSPENIKAFKKGQIDVLINVDLMTTGVDVPDVGCIGDCAPTKSLVKFFQRVGRGTRLKTAGFVAKYGQKCIVLDFLDNTTRHNIINTWTLDHKLPPEERIFLTSENRNKLIEERLKRSAKVDIKRNEDERVNLISLPKVKLNLSPKMNEPATEKQLRAVEMWGFDTKNTFYTKQQINEIFMSQPATDKQVNFLKSKGFRIDGFVSKAVAIKAFEILNANK